MFEAEVKDVVKGGLVVDIGVRGFIPASLVEAHFVEDFTDYKGKTLSLLVVELDRDKTASSFHTVLLLKVNKRIKNKNFFSHLKLEVYLMAKCSA